MNCPQCGAEMNPYDGGEARNYDADDLLSCGRCGQVVEVEPVGSEYPYSGTEYQAVADRTPDLLLKFDEGDYEHALRCYYLAKGWVLDTGQCFRSDMEGIIRSPQHPESPSARSAFVPEELIGKSGWSCTIEFYCATPEVIAWLRSLELPPGARWEAQLSAAGGGQ